MEAIIYTRDDSEYTFFKNTLEKEAKLIDVERARLNGHKRYDYEYDVVVVALEGAEGMEVVLEYSQRFRDTNIIWVTSDPFFAGTAMRNHIFDFIERPFARERIEKSIRDVVPKCPKRTVWHIPARTGREENRMQVHL